MLPDFTEGLQQENPTTSRSRRQKGSAGDRRETILSLVEMLLHSDEVVKREFPYTLPFNHPSSFPLRQRRKAQL